MKVEINKNKSNIKQNIDDNNYNYINEEQKFVECPNNLSNINDSNNNTSLFGNNNLK